MDTYRLVEMLASVYLLYAGVEVFMTTEETIQGKKAKQE